MHDHPEDLIIGDLDEGMKLRSAPLKKNITLLSTVEPKNFNEVVNDELQKGAMKGHQKQVGCKWEGHQK